MKKTKIVCTIGPASNSIKTMRELVLNGMNAARINMSHGNLEFSQKIVNNLEKVRVQTKKAVALLIDTKGPEIRIGTFKNGAVTLKKGQNFTLTTNEIDGNENIVTLKYKHLSQQIKTGKKIFANNGMICLRVTQITSTDIVCKVIVGGELSNNKALNIPKVVPQVEYLSEIDKTDLLFAIKNNANYIAASFVSSKEDIISLRDFLNANNASQIKIIAKIENDAGVKNLSEIINVSDGIMVARGDLGVEVPLEKIPLLQKYAVQKCHEQGKTVIIATEMLESMTTSSRPTRAEVSDVSNAIFEKVTATMLSGETAMGTSPTNAVKTMTKIALATEKAVPYNKDFFLFQKEIQGITDAVSHSVCANAISLKAKLIVVFTHSGQSANLLSRFRISTPILALTPFENVYNTLALYWNVLPHKLDNTVFENEDQMHEFAKALAKKNRLVKEGDIMLIQHGRPQEKGTTDMLKVIVC